MHIHRRAFHASAALLVGGIVFCGGLTAHRSHTNELVSEPPDQSNWPHPAAPDGNPFPRSTATPAELLRRDQVAQLGKALFWDEQVSTDNTVACGTCHMPEAGGTDNRPGAVHLNGVVGTFGVIRQKQPNADVEYGSATGNAGHERQVTAVNAPSMIGAYLFNRLFWDRRVGPDFNREDNTEILGFGDFATLESLSVGPPMSPVEMAHEGLTWASGHLQDKLNEAYPLAMVEPGTVTADTAWIVALNQTYRDVFNQVFGGDANAVRSLPAMA